MSAREIRFFHSVYSVLTDKPNQVINQGLLKNNRESACIKWSRLSSVRGIMVIRQKKKKVHTERGGEEGMILGWVTTA